MSKIIGVTVGTSIKPSKIAEKITYPIRQQKVLFNEAFVFNIELGKEYEAKDEQGTSNLSYAKLMVSYLDPTETVGGTYVVDLFAELRNVLEDYPDTFTFKVLGFGVGKDNTHATIIFEYCGEQYSCEITSFQAPKLKGIRFEWDGELYLVDPIASVEAKLGDKISASEARTLIKEELGAVENELDAIIDIQNTLIGGEEV